LLKQFILQKLLFRLNSGGQESQLDAIPEQVKQLLEHWTQPTPS